LFTVIVDQRYRRAQILTGNRALGRVHDRGAGQTGQFVGLTFDRDALFHTGEFHTTRHLGDDRVGVRIPGRNDIAGLDRTLVRHLDGRTVGQLVAFFFAASRIGYRQLTGAADRHPGALVFLDDFQVVQTHLTVGLDLDIVLRGSPRCRTTDVEGTHRQLRARLTDRLRSNNADSFTGVDAVTTGQIAAVADRADTVTGFTGDRRTHEDFVDTHLLEQTDPLLVDHRAGINHHLFGARTHDIPGHDTTQDAIAQRFDDVATGNDRGHAQAVFGAAIGVGDDQILRHVDQTAGQVTRVRGFQRGIGQTFTRTVGRDEVLQNRQTFAEVCGDRRLDDRAVRLRHQAAHTGELTDLGRRAPCARIGVHEHRVERRLALFLAFLVDDRLGRQTLHHRLGNEVVGARPDVDHLVVFLALGHQTRSVLLFDFNHFLIGATNDFGLCLRNFEVIDANRRAGTGRVLEACVHQLIGEYDRRLQTNLAVALVEDARDRLLGHRLVDEIELETLRHDAPQQHAADGGFDQLDDVGFNAVFIEGDLADTAAHTRLQISHAT